MRSELNYASYTMSGGRQVAVSGLASSALFVIVILYFWIGLSPFSSLSEPVRYIEVNSSNIVNQFVMMTVSLCVIVMLALHPASNLVGKLLGLLLVIFFWLIITGLFSIQPLFVLRRLTYALLTCICACGVLLLPRNSASFAKLMALCLLFVLGLCYFGVAALPYRAIHQASDAIEPGLAGDWRGYFVHKNTAAAAMVYTVFIALYIWKRHSVGLGVLFPLENRRENICRPDAGDPCRCLGFRAGWPLPTTCRRRHTRPHEFHLDVGSRVAINAGIPEIERHRSYVH